MHTGESCVMIMLSLKSRFRWERPKESVNSKRELFHDAVSDSYIADVWFALCTP